MLWLDAKGRMFCFVVFLSRCVRLKGARASCTRTYVYGEEFSLLRVTVLLCCSSHAERSRFLVCRGPDPYCLIAVWVLPLCGTARMYAIRSFLRRALTPFGWRMT